MLSNYMDYEYNIDDHLVSIIKEDLTRYHKYPDGTYSTDYDIILPRTTFDQVRVNASKSSNNLSTIIHDLNCAVEKRQYIIGEGSPDDILTKSKFKGQLDTLLKVNVVAEDPSERSSRRIPSELAVGDIYDIAKDAVMKASHALNALVNDNNRIESLETNIFDIIKSQDNKKFGYIATEGIDNKTVKIAKYDVNTHGKKQVYSLILKGDKYVTFKCGDHKHNPELTIDVNLSSRINKNTFASTNDLVLGDMTITPNTDENGIATITKVATNVKGDHNKDTTSFVKIVSEDGTITGTLCEVGVDQYKFNLISTNPKKKSITFSNPGSDGYFEFNHGLGTSDVVVSIRNIDTNQIEQFDTVITSDNVVSLINIDSSVTGNYRITVIG